MLPAATPYVAHFLEWKRYSLPTGFIQSDMPIYMAKAREAFDGGFGVFYANPCDGALGGEKLYFQPWTFLLGLIHRLTGWRAGGVFTLFWFGSALIAMRVALALIDEVAGRRSLEARVTFAWGGGVLALAGWLVRGWSQRFAFDPFEGWWFLNFGRNLVFPTEALYHALFLGSILRAIRGRTASALGLAALEASCSPFAGAELLSVLGLWSLVEAIVSSDRKSAIRFALGIAAISAIFLGYNVGFLGRYAEHRLLVDQMSLPWRYDAITPVLAYGPVLALALWRVASEGTRAVARSSRNRLWIVLAIVGFLLENHDWFVAPRQPLHFTRGYVWIALFLLGMPKILAIFDSSRASTRQIGRLISLLFLLVMLSDNALWLAKIAAESRQADGNGFRLTTESAEVLRRLDQDDVKDDLLVSEDERLSFLSLAETRLRAWVGHRLETPDYTRRRGDVERFFRDGHRPDAWRGRSLVVLAYRRPGDDPATRFSGSILFQNRKFVVVRSPQFASRDRF